MLAKFYIISAILAFLSVQGCVSVQSFPSIARAGDTITLALGSVDGLTKSNLHITYTPESTSTPIDLTSNIRNVIKVYPDRSSLISMGATTDMSLLTGFSGHAAWLDVVVVDLPESLPTGPGYFSIDFDDTVRVPNTAAIQQAEGVQITTEIVSGAGMQNDFSYYYSAGAAPLTGNLTKLKPQPQVLLRPKENTGYNFGSVHPAAAEYRIRIPVDGDIATLQDNEIHVIWDYKPGEDNKQIQTSWHRNDNVITVNVIVPTDSTLTEQMFQFSIVINPLVQGNKIDVSGAPELLSYRYFDLQGNEVPASYAPEVVIIQ